MKQKTNQNNEDFPEDLFPESPKQLIRKYLIMIGFVIVVFLIFVLITYLVAR